MKTCYVCKACEPQAQFYATSWMCKPCHKERDAKRKNRGSGGNHSEAAKLRKRRWSASHYPSERDKARRLVRSAIESGALVRKSCCESCGAERKRSDGVTAVQAHHDDYSKPLEVRWLCSACHTAWHKTNDAAMRKESE